MTFDSVPELARRVLYLEMELKRNKPSRGTDNAALLKRISALESSVAMISKATPAKPQVYTPKPAATVPKPTDKSLATKMATLEREVERLKVKESPIMSNYLLTTGKAADSDKLDGVDSTGFVKTTSTQTVAGVKTFSSIPVLPSSNPTTSNQAVRKGYADATYLGITAKAADADKLDGIDSTGFATAGHDHSGVYLPVSGKAADADKLDGVDSTGFATAGHDHNAAYLGITAKAADSDKLDGIDSSSFGRPVFLTTPLTSTDWDGDNKTTSDRAIVDLSTVFGVPAGVKAVLMTIQTQANAVNDYIRFGPNSTYNYALTCRTTVASQIAHASGIVPCDANGDVYCYPSGTVESVYVWIWGYWL